MNKEFGLNLKLPDRGNARSLSAAPMRALLRKAGFYPKERIDQILLRYDRDFSKDFPVYPFEGIEKLLSTLVSERPFLALGIISSNTIRNIMKCLAQFEDKRVSSNFKMIWGIDNGPSKLKSECFRMALNMLSLKGSEVIYVGDTAKDFRCANSMKMSFVGVNYGFENLSRELNPPHPIIVDTVSELCHTLMHLTSMTE